MADVPIYDGPDNQPGIPIQNPGVPQARLQPMGPEASSAGISEAGAKIGEGLTEIGSRLMMHSIMQERMKAQMEAYERETAIQQKADYFLKNPQTGLLNRTGKAAIGITSGNYPDNFMGPTPTGTLKFKDSWAGFVQQQLGTPDRPGEALAGLSPYQARTIQRRLGYVLASRGSKVISHEAQETKNYTRQTTSAAYDATLGSLSMATDPGDFNKALPALLEKASMLSALKGENQQDPNVQLETRQNAIQHAVDANFKANIQSHPEVAQKILNSLPKDALNADARAGFQKQLDNRMVKLVADHQFNDWQTYDGNGKPLHPQMLNPDGSLKESAVINESKTLYPDDDEKQQMFVKLVKEQDDQSNRLLNDDNEAKAKAFYSKAVTPGFSVDKLNSMAFSDQYAARLRNGRIDGKALKERLDFVRQANKATRIQDDIPTKVALNSGMADGSTQRGDVVQAMSDEKLSPATGVRMLKTFDDWKTPAQQSAWKLIGARAKAEFTNKDDYNQFMNSLIDERDAKHVTDPAELGKLYEAQKKIAPNGAASLFGRVKNMFEANPEIYQLDAQLRGVDPHLVKTLGGPSAAADLAQNIGGTERMMKAIDLLRTNKYPVTSEAIKNLNAHRPELLK